ncbi:MAG: hypothetical protein ABMA01_01810 [Chthoniobacteraceae bacterium]
MNTQEQQTSTSTPERRPEGDESAAGANLAASRAAHERRQQIARAQLEKAAAQNAEQELETRRQRGGE